MSSFRIRALSATLVLLAAMVFLGSCGFRPLYDSREGAGIPAQLATIDVKPISDRMGQQLRNHLLTRLTPRGRPAYPRYTLNVTINESTQGLAVRKSSFATRANLRVSANFTLRLVEGGGKDALLSDTLTLLSSYNIIDSEFATLKAQMDARSHAIREIAVDIHNRLAIYFGRQRRPAQTPGQ